MSGFQLAASLTQSLAWPVAVVLAVVVLRKPLAGFITRRPPQRVKAGPFEVEWDRLAAETEMEIEGAPGALGGAGQPAWGVLEELAPAAQETPVVAVQEAYATVERELRQIVGDDGSAQPASLGTVGLARYAEDKGLLNTETVRAVEGLSVMRNLAVHSGGREISPEKAAEYLALTDAVLYTIRQQKRGR